jgi:YD repeat-containing protein
MKVEWLPWSSTLTRAAYVTSYSFDKNGNLQQITYPSGRTVSYTLDAAYRISSVSTAAPRSAAAIIASSVAHKPYGGIFSMTYGNGLARSVSEKTTGKRPRGR